ncbi:MAG: NFACT family protein [Clostridiales bacterium]|nr:NFACT family protein [Clostridiales bacterium]
MPLDGIFLRFLTNEIKNKTVGSRIEKVYQPSADEIVLSLRSRLGAQRLLISASPNCPRLHLTNYAPENPPKPPMLCMLLRKYLCGAAITDITQNGTDRTVFIDLDATNEIGDKRPLRLCVEIMAKHSNIVLVTGDGIVVDAVKRIDMTKSSYRQILPSLPYVMPPAQEKLDPVISSEDELLSSVLSYKNDLLSSAILRTIQGISPLISREFSYTVCGGDNGVYAISDAEKKKLYDTLKSLKMLLINFGGKPYMLKNPEGRPTDFSYVDVGQYGSSYKTLEYDTFSELLDSFYYERERADRTRQRAFDMLKTVDNAIIRTSKKISVRQKELEECAHREEFRIKAELINANLGVLKKGAFFYDVENYYDDMKIMRIPADPSLSPAANAQKYYRDYRKAKTAEQMLTGLIDSGEQELQYLDSVSDLLHRADANAELDAIRLELENGGYMKHHGRKNEKNPKPLPPMEYVSSDGFNIYVGRSNVQNDKLSLKTAKGNDLWLHTQKIPGSHVIISSNGRTIPPSTIEQAAVIAAYHSKARESSQVPVDYTEAKNLKKPVGSKPGKVIYHVYKTLIVTPDREYVEKLKK